MYGTLRGALAVRKIELRPETYKADVEGRIESTDQGVRITQIAVHYHLVIPAGKRPEVERALDVHAKACEAYLSVRDAIQITWSADIKEE